MAELGEILPVARIEAMRAAGWWHDRTGLDYLADALARDPTAPAIVAYEAEGERVHRLSWREVDALSTRFALALLDLGIRPGDVVSLQLPNWWQFSVLHLACLKAGAITNPLMPIFREAQLRFMLGFAETRLLVAPARFNGFDYAPMIDGLRAKLPALTHAFFIGGSGPASFEADFLDATRNDDGRLDGLARGPNEVTEIIYTSGTTGEPKGAMHTANTLFGHYHTLNDILDLGPGDVFYMASPLAHQTGFHWGICHPLQLGCTAVLQDKWDGDRAAHIIAAERPTFTVAATPFLNDLCNVAEAGGPELSSLRYFACGGAQVPPALVERARFGMGLRVLSIWGMTECAAATICRPEDPDGKIFGSDGRAIDCCEVRVVGDARRSVGPGIEGELQTRGSTLFVGYLKRPDLFATDVEGWFDTGDRARMDEDGYIRITGRSKDIILRGAENIPVVEVEAMLYGHPGIDDVAVVAMPDPRLGERGCAYVTLNAGHELSLADMAAYLTSRGMTRQYLPERLEILDAFPRTPSGKIQKFVLREWARELMPEREGEDPMSDDVSARLAALEAKVRELDDIEQLRRLRCEYHQAINEGWYDRIPAMWVADGSLDFSYIGRAQGEAKITKFFGAAPDVLPFIKQFIHNHVVAVDGDTGTGYSYMEARTINNGRAFNVAGRYDDDYVRVDGVWKFRHMKFDAYFTVPFEEGWAQDDVLKMARRDTK